MNSKRSITHFILIITFLCFSCREAVKVDTKNNASASSISFNVGDEKYAVIDKKETVVIWKGSMQIGSDSHTGFVSISKGELLSEKGELTGGTIEVDMNTIEDETHRSDNNLIKHLKDPDFFDVQKFPLSTIVITEVESIDAVTKKVIGNLTIKGITHPVSFPAKVEIKDGIVKANGKLVIDRTLWGIRYNSGKFFDNLKDQAIADSIEFNIKIVAKNKIN